VTLPTAYGEFHAIGYQEKLANKQHLALVHGDVAGQPDVLVRVHSECLTGDVFGSLRCDCGEQLHLAMQQVVNAGSGVVLYMAQEGRGIGLMNKLRAYELQEQGRDTVEANLELGFMDDQREYGIGAQILADLGLSTIKILTNNPRKIIGLEGYGLKVTEQVPIEVDPNDRNLDYLRAKRDKLGHSLHHQHLKAADELPGEPPRMVDPAAGETAGAER
jgi:3,4-dihydroxy 2-butanone 4-phosphate synthase/GTP cyclohydrolase II